LEIEISRGGIEGAARLADGLGALYEARTMHQPTGLRMHHGISQALAALLSSLLAASAAHAEPRGEWHDAYTTRLEALALLQTLNAELLSGDSATLTLDRWCASHALAAPARVIAERVSGSDAAATPEQRQLLGVGPAEPVRFRRVRLKCGAHVLSEAENWYVPSRLTPT
jgi:hypothetical protein